MLVVISGGSQGLGAELAREYAKRGDEVVIVARTESKLKVASADIGGLTRYIAADVSEPKECDRVFSELGSVPDLVFCCAGSANPGMFLELSGDQLAASLRTVYNTALFFSHAALRSMAGAADKLETRRHLVYCSSTVAVFPFIGYSSYAPGKAAIRSLADIVRQEAMVHNVRVSHILPGSMATEGYDVEELTKPAVTKKIEGASPPLGAAHAAKLVVRQLDKGSDTVYTDTIGWILGSMMLGTSPRTGPLWGLVQAIVGSVLALFGFIVRWSIDSDVRADSRDSSAEGS